jgi:hypothetical protein
VSCHACSTWSCLVEGLPPRVSDEGTLEPSLRLNRHLGSNPRVRHGMKIFAASIRPFLAEVMPLLQFQPAFLGVLGVSMSEEITWSRLRGESDETGSRSCVLWSVLGRREYSIWKLQYEALKSFLCCTHRQPNHMTGIITHKNFDLSDPPDLLSSPAVKRGSVGRSPPSPCCTV